MKKIRGLMLALLLLLGCFSTVAYAENSDRVVDNADLLTDAEEASLEEQYTQIAEKYQYDIAVVTTNTLNGKSAQDYADDYYYDNGYGYGESRDGLMLLVSMEDRDWHITTRGKGEENFSSRDIDDISEAFLSDLSAGNYYDAFRIFGEESGAVITAVEEPMSVGLRALIAAGAGLVIALIVFAVLMSQLKSVRVKREAQDYVREGSFHLTRSNDLFLYRTVDRRKIERDDDDHGSHSTSDGGSAGGGGGKF